MPYHHTQTGTVIIVSICLVILFMLGTGFAVGVFLPVQAVVTVLLVLVGYLFSSLTVDIAGGRVTCRFGPGFIRREIPLSNITDVRTVTNTWLTGWGIRWSPGQYVLWNVSGFGAVELTLTSGKRFRVGTDEPDVLEQAIRSNIASMTH
jgi:hypothetical protein